MYDSIDPASSIAITDSTSLVIMSDIFVPHLQYLGARKEMAELGKGGAGQDKAFWEDIAIEFNDYSKDEYSELSLSSLLDKKVFFEKR